MEIVTIREMTEKWGIYILRLTLAGNGRMAIHAMKLSDFHSKIWKKMGDA